MDEQRKESRKQAIVIAAAIFAARDLATDWNGAHASALVCGIVAYRSLRFWTSGNGNGSWNN